MPFCKYCGVKFAWGRSETKWVPLVPLGEEGDLDRTFQDENGQLRASHNAICQFAGGATVRVSELAKPIPADQILIPYDPANVPLKKRKRR